MSEYPWNLPCEEHITMPQCKCDPCFYRRVVDSHAGRMAEAILAYWEKGDEHDGIMAAFPEKCSGPSCTLGRIAAELQGIIAQHRENA